jgi:uncharacterized protein involved in exopolysaccharide biosynthesis
MDGTAFDFSALLQRLTARWRTIALNAFLAGAAAFGLTFLMPSWFRSTAVLLPPEETEQVTSGLTMQRFLSRMPALGMLPGYYSAADIHRAILMSRTVQDAVIRRFDLERVYRKKSPEKTLLEFRRHVGASLNPDGTITVTAEDRDRTRAAGIANALIEELDRFNVERRNVQARRTRQFFERRVAETDSVARASEALLRAYQEKHHVVAPADVENVDVAPLADLMARKTSLEVRLAVLRSYLNEGNESIVQTRTELGELRRRIDLMPGVESELGRLVRDVKLYQQVYVLLNAQLEDARLRETMDTPTVTVLDPAFPSEKHSRPLRRWWAAGAALAGAAITVLWLEGAAARQA